MKLFDILDNYIPERLAFNQLTTLKAKHKDMRERRRKRIAKNKRLDERDIQREKVEALKLNFVSGLLNRFFFSFLEEFKMDIGDARRHTMKNVSVTMQERQMAMAMINEKSTVPSIAKIAKSDAQSGEGTNRAQANTEAEQQNLEYMKTLLQPRARQPLSLAHLKALPVPFSQFKVRKAKTKFLPNRTGGSKKNNTQMSSSSDTDFS